MRTYLISFILLLLISCKKDEAESIQSHDYSVEYSIAQDDTIAIRYMEGTHFVYDTIEGDWSLNTSVTIRDDQMHTISCVANWCDTAVHHVDIHVNVVGYGDGDYSYPTDTAYCTSWSGVHISF